MENRFLVILITVLLSSCSSLSISDETYAKYPDIKPILQDKIYRYNNCELIDKTKMNHNDIVVFRTSIWNHIKPNYKPKNDDWKYGYVEMKIKNQKEINFVLKDHSNIVIDTKDFRYKIKGNFVELSKQTLAEPLYIVLWVLGRQKIALGLTDQQQLKILRKYRSFGMLIFLPTFGGGDFEVSKFEKKE